MRQAPTLNPRRQSLLEFIVGDYILTAAPVASQQIVRRHDLRVSPATIRNDMAELEEMGYISRPHASAGGIPADLAYRFYVERTSFKARPTREFEMQVQDAIHQETGDPENWAQRAATILSDVVQNVAVATSPRVAVARMKQLQLVHLQDQQALLVVVLQDAKVKQHLVQMARPYNQNELSELAMRLNTALAGKTADEIRTVWDAAADAPEVTADAVVAEVLGLLVEAEQGGAPRHYTEGLRHMLGQPEFQSGPRAREAVEAIEDGQVLRPIIDDAGRDAEVDVIIGEENRQATLRPYSVVLARYGLPGQVMGVIGTLGPTRMDYTLAISSVRYIADFLSDLLSALADERD
jgi:heat-inducible transcriptional repressor